LEEGAMDFSCQLLTNHRQKPHVGRQICLRVGCEQTLQIPQRGRRTHVIYIGTTRRRAHRAASSAVEKSAQMFGEIHGLKQIGVYVLRCKPRRTVNTWRELESTLLGAFKNRYYELPKKNKRNERATKPERYFNERGLRAFL